MPKTKDAFAYRKVLTFLQTQKTSTDIDNRCAFLAGREKQNLDLAVTDEVSFAKSDELLAEIETFFTNLNHRRATIRKQCERLDRYVERILISSLPAETKIMHITRAKKIKKDYEYIFDAISFAEMELAFKEKNVDKSQKKFVSANFGRRLRYARILKDKTVGEMAHRLKITKFSYARYESGEREPSLWMLRKISRLLDVSVDELLRIE